MALELVEGYILQEAIAASITASQTSGHSPLGVVFSCDQTTAAGYDSHEVFRLFGYYFDFDDSTSGTFSTTRGGSKNTQIGGPLAAHTFIVADGGGTVEFEVLVNIKAPNGAVGQASVTITVQAQDTAFSAANTICVSTTLDKNIESQWTAGHDRNCPAGAVYQNTLPAWNALSGKRLMLHRGNADFSAVVQTIQYGSKDIAITDFGNDADTRAEMQVIHLGTQGDSAFDTTATNADFDTYGGIWIDNVTIDSIRLWEFFSGISNTDITLHDLDMDAEAESTGGRLQTNRSHDSCYVAANNLTPANVPFSNGFVVSDTTIVGSDTIITGATHQNNVFLREQSNVAFIGCTIRHAEEHNLRSHGIHKYAVHNCDLLGEHLGGQPKSRITCRGVGYNDAGDITGQDHSIVTGFNAVKDNQDETFYDNSPVNEGTFAGGSGYSVSDVITITDGATVTVDAVSGGVVTQFTVDGTTDAGTHSDTDVLSQTSVTPSGGTGFALTVGINNINVGMNRARHKLTCIQTCWLSAGDTGDATWGMQFAPSATTEYQLGEDAIMRDLSFDTAAAKYPTNEITLTGRYVTSTENTDEGNTTDTVATQELGTLGVVTLSPNYIDPTAIPVPTGPRA